MKKLLIGLFMVSLCLPALGSISSAQESEPLAIGRGRIRDVALSPDATQIAIAAYDGVHLYDVASQERLQFLEMTVYEVAFSPDGAQLAAASASTGYLIDPNAGTTILEWEMEKRPLAMSFSGDGSRIVTASDRFGKQVSVWDATTGEEIIRVEGSSTAAFVADGTQVATENAGLVIYDAATGDVVADNAANLAEEYDPLGFHPNGELVLVEEEVDDVIEVSLYNVGDGSKQSVPAFERSASLGLFNPDGSLMALARGGTVRIIETASLAEVSQLSWGAPGWSGVPSYSFDGDGSHMAIGSYSTATVYDTSSGEAVASLYHVPYTHAVTFSPDGSKVAVIREPNDNNVEIFDTTTGESLGILHEDSNGFHRTLFFTSDGRLWVLDGAGLQVWDVEGMTLLDDLEPEGLFQQAALHPDETQAALVDDGVVTVLSLETGEVLTTFDTGIGERTEALAYSPDGSLLALGFFGSTFSIWNTSDYSEVATVEAKNIITSGLDFSPDSQFLVVTGQQEHITIYEAASGTEVATVDSNSNDFSRATFLSDERLIGTGRATLVDYNSQTLEEQAEILSGVTPVTDIAISADGTQAAFVDRSFRVYIVPLP